MKLLIFGASGATGRELVDRALALGHQVTGYVRDPARLANSHERLAVVQGDLADRDRLADVIAGQDAVLCALGVGRPLRRDPAVVDGVRHIIEVMEHQSVRRFLYLSFVGVAASRRDAGPLIRHLVARIVRNEIADHECKEDLVMRSDLDWTIVRAPKLTNAQATHAYRGGEHIQAESLLPKLSRADVADFMLRHVADPTYIRKAPSVLPDLAAEARLAHRRKSGADSLA